MKRRLFITLLGDEAQTIEAADGTAVDFEGGVVRIMGPDVVLEVPNVRAIYISFTDILDENTEG